ncbi:MAG: HlyD family efflux transporter periplasmic adaptor subunit, partial [Planctomycetota bacterium]
HELSHGMACERFGAECQSTGLAFLFFSPCMYCDVTDAWMLERKSHRLAISMAGVYVELFISSVGLWLWWFSAPGLFHQVCLQVFLAGSIATLLFNANPLLRFDGYYVLADLLEVPNLYSKSRQSIMRLAARFLLGIRLPDDPSVSGSESSLILITYGVASLGYQLLMLIGLVFFLYGMLEPIGMAAIAWLVILVFLMARARRFLKWNLRMVRIQKSPARAVLQSLVAAACCTAALIGLWFCPLGNAMTAPVVLEPRVVQPVYVETAGTVRSIHAREGDVVQQGALLLELENLELDRQLAAMEGVLATHETDFRLAQASGNPDLMVLARTAIESCTDQISHVRTELERLQLRANVSGRLISTNGLRMRARRTPDEPSEESAGILNSRLIGMPLQRKDCLCEIAPTSKWQATLWIDQRSRQFLSPGQHVNVCLDAFPGAIVTGTIAAIGVANEPEIPAVLSIKFGGQFTSKTTDGGESPAEPVYQATVLLDEVNLPVQRGMRGTGRFTRSPRTIGSWLTDEFHQLFVAR